MIELIVIVILALILILEFTQNFTLNKRLDKVEAHLFMIDSDIDYIFESNECDCDFEDGMRDMVMSEEEAMDFLGILRKSVNEGKTCDLEFGSRPTKSATKKDSKKTKKGLTKKSK